MFLLYYAIEIWKTKSEMHANKSSWPLLHFHKPMVFNRIKLFNLHYLFLEFGWIFLALNEVWERKLLSRAFCSSSAGEDIWLDWKLLCVLCFEEQWGIGLHWCGWRQYHPAPSGHIKVCLADGLDRGWENRGLFLISIWTNCFTNRIFKALDCKSY